MSLFPNFRRMLARSLLRLASWAERLASLLYDEALRPSDDSYGPRE